MSRALPDVHVAGRAPAAASDRQRRPASDADSRRIGLVDDERWSRFEERRARLARNRDAIARATVTIGGERLPATRALRQPTVDVRQLANEGQLALEIREPLIDFASLETGYRFEGYLKRQEESVARMKRQESKAIPVDLRFDGISGLSREAVERLTSVRPETIGQALRIPGMTAAAVALIAAHLAGGARA